MAPINGVTITLMLFTVIALVLIVIYAPDESDEQTWSPLLPESEKREWDRKGHTPFGMCPRCNSLNTVSRATDTKQQLLVTKVTFHFRCKYCGYEWLETTHR